MTDYDYTSWQFLDAIGQASPLQDEAMSIAFEFPSTSPSTGNGQLMSSDNCLPYGQTSATAKQGYMQHSPPIEMGLGIEMQMEMEMEMEMFAQGMEFSVPTFPDLNLTLGPGKNAPDLSLLRSASLNAAAAERALFMTPSVASPSSSPSTSSNQHSSPSLDLDPCTPSTTSTSSKDSDEDCDWDHPTATNLHYYKLPDRVSFDSSFQAIPRPPRHVHHHHHPHRVNNHNHCDIAEVADAEGDGEELTPLEMPDGTTRFTANWLPVDPTGGFTIGIEERAASVPASAAEYGYEYGNGYGQEDHAYGYAYQDPVSLEFEFSKEAFIQMPQPAPV